MFTAALPLLELLGEGARSLDMEGRVFSRQVSGQSCPKK